MSLLLLYRLSASEFKFKAKTFLTLLFILGLGVLGPILVSTIRTSSQEFIFTRARDILSADISISNVRPFTEAEQKLAAKELEPLAETSETQFMTMARGPQTAILSEVHAVSTGFPLNGKIILKDGRSSSTDLLNEKPIAWVHPEVLSQLGLKAGDDITIGALKFHVAGVVAKDSILIQSSFAFAPRLYIGEKFAAQTGLQKSGSQIFYRRYYKLPQGQDAKESATELKAEFDNPNIFIRTPDDAIEGFSRFIDFFTRYLSIMTLIIFSVSWVAAFYIFQTLGQEHVRASAVMLSLGATRRQIALVYLVQSVFLNCIAFAVALLLSSGALEVASTFFQQKLPDGFAFHLNAVQLYKIFAASLITGICFVLTLLLKISRVSMQILLTESNSSSESSPAKERYLIWGLTAVTYLVLASLIISPVSFALSLALGLVAASLVSLAFSQYIFRMFRKWREHNPGFLRILSVNLAQMNFAKIICFIAISLVATVMNIVPNLIASIENDISPARNHELPSLFLFNIPEERLEDLKKFCSEHGTQLDFISPLVLGRLTQVNHEPSKSDFFLKFPLRMTYRKELFPSEKLIEGEPFPADGGSLVSLEKGFAERWNFKIGDQLTFDIQGVEIETTVHNFRQVKWSEFNPNFFIEFAPGLLDDAPKSWLANIHSNEPEEKRILFETELLKEFPDVSVIDVGRSVAQITQFTDSLIEPAEWVSSVVGFLSLLILAFVVVHNLSMRRFEMTLLKILSPSMQKLRVLLSSEYLVLSGLALISGSVCGLAIAKFVCNRWLKVEFIMNTGLMSASLIAFVFIIFVGTDVLLRQMFRSQDREGLA